MEWDSTPRCSLERSRLVMPGIEVLLAECGAAFAGCHVPVLLETPVPST